ncbi:MAG TPA: cupin domain-containing protein [Pyrinomonadaceae bacterium]|jgi:mannose-6-phosphate isomerase-like protein (cupin superfamily)
MIEKVNLSEKFGLFSEHWSPKIAGAVGDAYVKLVKFRGEFVWHKHDGEDEMFFVVKGEITIRLRDGDVRLGEGEFVVIPRGVEHKPVAEEEAHVLLFEPKTVLNTGDVVNELTRPELERV